MGVRLKRLEDQVMVITGASSGIGLVTARKAAARGARLVLGARNTDAIKVVAEQIHDFGGEAVPVVVDVGREEEVQRLADTALRRFGRFDTWINNAGVSIYGRMEDVPVEDERRLFDTNYWGIVYGSRIAARHLREHGGALINLGSIVSDFSLPLQGAYCASKHAVKGFTDALRMELEAGGAPVSVTLIKPGATDTPFDTHSENYMDREPRLPPPVYAPELAARAILYAAEHPVRDLYVGGAGRMMSLMGIMAPRLTDRILERTMFAGQQRNRPAAERPHGLHGPGADLSTRSPMGNYATRERSLYTAATLHPLLSLAIGAGVAAAAAAAWTASARR